MLEHQHRSLEKDSVSAWLNHARSDASGAGHVRAYSSVAAVFSAAVKPVARAVSKAA